MTNLNDTSTPTVDQNPNDVEFQSTPTMPAAPRAQMRTLSPATLQGNTSRDSELEAQSPTQDTRSLEVGSTVLGNLLYRERQRQRQGQGHGRG